VLWEQRRKFYLLAEAKIIKTVAFNWKKNWLCHQLNQKLNIVDTTHRYTVKNSRIDFIDYKYKYTYTQYKYFSLKITV
jgi:hypothetical protein